MYGKAKGFAFVVLHASLLAPLLISAPEAAKHINLDMTHSTGRDRAGGDLGADMKAELRCRLSQAPGRVASASGSRLSDVPLGGSSSGR